MTGIFRVKANRLNLRSGPGTGSNVVGVLEQGDTVVSTGLTEQGWIPIKVIVADAELAGFVKLSYLQPMDLQNGSAVSQGGGAPPEVHLSGVGRRSQTSSRAQPLRETSQPARPNKSAAELKDIIDWLKVEASPRYQPTNVTFCNIYAYDYCFLSGVYLPRVWWYPGSISRWENNIAVEVSYGETVRELRANDLYDWLQTWGTSFGWMKVPSLDAIQSAANEGKVGVIVAKRIVVSKPGHIVAVAPEGPELAAKRSGGHVTWPVMSQAGASNFRYGYGSKFWNDTSKFQARGFYVHD